MDTAFFIWVSPCGYRKAVQPEVRFFNIRSMKNQQDDERFVGRGFISRRYERFEFFHGGRQAPALRLCFSFIRSPVRVFLPSGNLRESVLRKGCLRLPCASCRGRCFRSGSYAPQRSSGVRRT